MNSTRRNLLKGLCISGAAVPLSGYASSTCGTVGMFRGNATHTYYGSGKVSDTPKIIWKYEMGGFTSRTSGKMWTGTGWTGTAVIHKSSCYIGSLDRRLYCFDRMTGKKQWVFTAREMFKSSAAYFAGRIFIGNVDNHIYCINAGDGSLLWSYDTGKDCDSSPTIADNCMFIGGESGWMHCFRPDTGRLVWRTFLGGLGGKAGSNGVEGSPAVWEGRVYVANYLGELFCLRQSDGGILWKASTGDDTDTSPVVSGGMVFVAAEEKSPYVFAFDARTGKKIWHFGGPGAVGFWSTPAVVADRLYIGDFGNSFYCLDAKKGSLIWKKQLSRGVWSSPAVVDGKVLFGSYDSHLYVLDAQTGSILSAKRLDGRIISSPVVEDGYIYVGTATGMFYCLR